MAVYDRWHTRKPRLDEETGEPITCEHRKDGQPLYPSADHGVGDRWQVRWRDETGKQCKRNFPKKAGRNPNVHADAFDAQVQHELKTGTYIDPTAGETTLAEWAATWRAGLTGKPETLAVTDRRLAHIYDIEPDGRRARRYTGTSSIGHRSMRELSQRPQLVQTWVKELEARGVGPQYIHHIAQTLSSIFLAAIENGLITRNPMHSRTVKLPPIPERPVQPWTAKQVQAAAEYLDDGTPTLGAIPYLGAGAGLRASEIFGFAVEDIDTETGIVRVRRQVVMTRGTLCFTLPKHDRTREAPLSESLAARLDAHMDAHPPEKVTLPWGGPDGDPVTVRLLFVRRPGVPFYRRTFDLSWVGARAAAGAPATPENGTHVLRHTFASATLAAGVDIRTLADWLGHKDPGFTLKRYVHLMPSAAARGRAAIDKFFRDL